MYTLTRTNAAWGTCCEPSCWWNLESQKEFWLGWAGALACSWAEHVYECTYVYICARLQVKLCCSVLAANGGSRSQRKCGYACGSGWVSGNILQYAQTWRVSKKKCVWETKSEKEVVCVCVCVCVCACVFACMYMCVGWKCKYVSGCKYVSMVWMDVSMWVFMNVSMCVLGDVDGCKYVSLRTPTGFSTP